MEANWVRLGSGLLGGDGSPISFHLSSSYTPFKDISFQIKAGSTLMSSFQGWEFGILGKSIFYSPFYTSFGVLQHANEGGIGSNTWGTNSASILFLYGGLGIDAAKFFSFELGYYLPTSKKVTSYSWNYDHSISYTHIVSNMIRLSFIFGWNIL